jgi:carbon-monoxide dehydrogenase medium subunit
MSGIAYVEAESVQEACEWVAQPGTRLLAGGTALALLLRQGLISDERFVSLHRIAGLRRISTGPEGITIGAMVTHHEAATAPAIQSAWPALADLYAAVATRRIRNVATVGGSLAHGDPHLDPPVALMALEATVTAESVDGSRRIALDQLFHDYYETSLAPNEVLTTVTVPAPEPGSSLAAIKFLSRSRDDYATVDVAVRLKLKGDTVADIRIALGSVGPTVIRVPEAEARLTATAVGDDAALEAAGTVAAEAADPETDVRGSADYKRDLIKVLVRRAVRDAVRRARDTSGNSQHGGPA